MKKFLAVLCGIVMFLPASACDICGNSLHYLNPYLFPHQSKSFFGFAYYHNHYRLSEDGSVSDQFNNAYVFSGQITFNRLRLIAILPYQFNTIGTWAAETKTSGVGDATLLANQ